MNKARRKQIGEVINNIEAIQNTLDNILNDELDAYDSMPEGLQSSENGMISEDAQESLECAINTLEEAIMSLEEI